MESKFDSLTHEQKLKVSVFNEVRKICEEVGKGTKVNFDRKMMDLLSEIVWRKLKLYGEDLEAFAKHAKRATVNSEDVRLLVRRNAVLKEHIGRLADEQSAAREPRKTKQSKAREQQPAPQAESGSEAGASTSSSTDPPAGRVESPLPEPIAVQEYDDAFDFDD